MRYEGEKNKLHGQELKERLSLTQALDEIRVREEIKGRDEGQKFVVGRIVRCKV